MGRARIDLRGMKDFQKKIENLSRHGLDDVEQDLCKNLANRVIRGAVKRTPVISGHLKGNFKMSAVYSTGNGYTVTVYNPVKYAPYVEYGHRTRGGGWCNGKFMLTKATGDVEKQAPKIVDKAITEEIARLLK